MNNQTPLAPHLSAFLQDHMLRERQVSIHTGDTYSYAFQLLLLFASKQRHRTPSALYLEDLDAELVLEFLRDLETQRGNSARTRNARLAAIKSFFRFVEYRVPACIDQARRVHGIPTKRTDEALVGYLSHDEMQAVLNAPDPKTPDGIRDRAMLHLAFAAGLRVSELVGLRLDQLSLQPQCSIHIRGKGRRERILPLWKETAITLSSWLAVRGTWPEPELFLNARYGPMTRSGFEYILSKHVHAATAKQPSLSKKRVSPHVLRHTCAMRTLQATGDIRKVALWLGHASTQSTEVYVRADPSEKLEALVTITPPTLRRGRFTPPDKLLALLRPEKR